MALIDLEAYPNHHQFEVVALAARDFSGKLGRKCFYIVQVIEMIEAYREVVASVQETFMTATSNRMNEVMKVLTVIATIFIPLTFIVGLYGMNFDYMPELRHPYGYFMVWGVMIAVVVVMLVYFRKRQWI